MWVAEVEIFFQKQEEVDWIRESQHLQKGWNFYGTQWRLFELSVWQCFPDSLALHRLSQACSIACSSTYKSTHHMYHQHLKGPPMDVHVGIVMSHRSVTFRDWSTSVPVPVTPAWPSCLWLMYMEGFQPFSWTGGLFSFSHMLILSILYKTFCTLPSTHFSVSM